MRFTSSVRTFSLGLATASFLLAGSALAQQSSSARQDQLVGVNAQLEHSLSSKSAHSGERVTAKLDGNAKTPEGVKLPKGTELEGTVMKAQASENGGPAKVSILFNEAQLRDGKTVPVHAILLAAFPASKGPDSGYGHDEVGSAPRHVSAQEEVDQKAGLLSHVSMHSDMHGHDSATFIRKDGDFTLRAGTYLQVGIAPRESSMNSGAM